MDHYLMTASTDRTESILNVYTGRTEEKCDQYTNWIKATKQKLKEREFQLMSVRITTLQRVINQQCEFFEKINSDSSNNKMVTISNYNRIIINTHIIDECLNKLYLLLSTWTGVNIAKTKKSLSTFRKYFAIGKCWFDQKKKSIIAPDFWIKYFLTLETFASDSANIYFKGKYKQLQILYSKHLLLQIISGIFDAEIHFAATKPQPLISCAIIKDSIPMKIYLNNIDSSLNVDTIIAKELQSNHKKNKKKLNAKDILDLVNKELKYLTNKFHNEFQKQLKQIYWTQSSIINHKIKTTNNAFAVTETDQDQEPIIPQIPQIIPQINMNATDILPPLPPLPLPPILSTHNSNYNYYNDNQSVSQSVNYNHNVHGNGNNNTYNYNNHNNYYNDTSYINNHSPSQSVISQRYNPMNGYNNCCYCCCSCSQYN
eukprot:184288_1